MNTNTIDIAFAADEKYVKYCTVAIISLKESQKDFDKINIYVLAGKLSANSIKNLKRLAEENFTITIINASDKFDFDIKRFSNSMMPEPTYYRLMLADLLPQVDKILYLDSDLIVKGSLKSLWKENLENHILAGVKDINSSDIMKRSGINFSGCEYINAGVILINLKKWRADNINEKIEAFSKKYPEKITYCDQCLLNYVLADGQIKMLKDKWNFHHDQQNTNIQEAVIIHFIWGKPWNPIYFNPYRNCYWEVVKKTDWKYDIYPYLILNFLYSYKILFRKTKNFIKNKIIRRLTK